MEKAKKISKVDTSFPCLFYYNPMWKVMAKDETLGTYYNEYDNDGKSFYWYTFDQVLIRPALIDDFDMNELQIVHKIGDETMLKKGRINSDMYSDHLPIKFRIR